MSKTSVIWAVSPAGYELLCGMTESGWESYAMDFAGAKFEASEYFAVR